MKTRIYAAPAVKGLKYGYIMLSVILTLSESAFGISFTVVDHAAHLQRCPVNTKHLYNISTMLDQRQKR